MNQKEGERRGASRTGLEGKEGTRSMQNKLADQRELKVLARLDSYFNFYREGMKKPGKKRNHTADQPTP